MASLALGIGANTAIFSVLDALEIRRLPIPTPEQLVVFGDDAFLSYGAYQAFSQAREHFEGIVGTSEPAPADITVPSNETESAAVELVTASYFHVLGLPATAVRIITEQESRTL